MYILRESRQNEADGQKISGQYQLMTIGMIVSLKYFDMNTENPQARLNINGLDMEFQDYPDAAAEFQQITDAANAECAATGASFLNLSDIEVKPIKRASTAKRSPQKRKETETQAEATEVTEATETESKADNTATNSA